MGTTDKPKLSLIGRPALTFADAPVALPEKAYLLLAALVAAPGFTLDRDYIRRLLWQSDDSKRRAGSLRQLLARLQDNLSDVPPFLTFAADAITFDTSRCDVDVEWLRAAHKPLPRHTWASLSGEVLEATELPTIEAEEWLTDFRRRITDKKIQHLERLLDEDGIDKVDMILLAGTLVDMDPSNEGAWRKLMIAQAASGDASSARQSYLKCRNQLKDSLGTGPSAETNRIARELGFITANSVGDQPMPVEKDMAIMSEQPRVVILPPETIIKDPLIGRLGRALLEDVTVALSNQRVFRIIAAHTSLELVSKSSEPNQLQSSLRQLNFDYSVYVTLQGEHDEISATCRLTKVATGEVLWAIDLPLDIHRMSATFHQLGRRISTSLTNVIERHEMARPIDDVNATAYRLYLEGKRYLAGTELKLLRQARKWFKASLQLSGDYSPSHAGVARTLSLEYLVRLMKDHDLLDQANIAALEAHERDPSNGRAFRELGYVALYRRRHSQSLAYYQQARELNPHDADLLADYADALCHDGQLEEALEAMQSAFAVNPLPSQHYHWYLGGIYFMMEEYDKALDALDIIRTKPAVARLLAAIYASKGDIKQAGSFARIVLEHYPDFRTEQLWHFMPDRKPDDTKKLIAGLNAAGLQ